MLPLSWCQPFLNASVLLSVACMVQLSTFHTMPPPPSAALLRTSVAQQSCCGLLLQGDLTDKKTVDQVAEKAKTVDILVNNAGTLDKESILEGNCLSICCPADGAESLTESLQGCEALHLFGWLKEEMPECYRLYF